jgi:transcriptional regulator GlxA family with amidase domain
MAARNSGSHSHSSVRRVIVVVVPPVDELDLVGPLQVFNSVNRLAGRKIYAIEVVTNSDCLTFEGEGGVSTFGAKHHFNRVEGPCDSVLPVCRLTSGSVRDTALSAWLKKTATEVRRLGAVCVGAFLLAEAGLLNGRTATTHWRFGRENGNSIPTCTQSTECILLPDVPSSLLVTDLNGDNVPDLIVTNTHLLNVGCI